EAGLSPAERGPADGGTEPEADRHGGTEAPAEPADQSRCEDREGDDRTGRPVPARAQVDPATVVERRPSPGGGVKPRPAPGIGPDPSPRRVRAPVRTDVGSPDVAVAAPVLPLAVGVEILGAVDVLAHVPVALRPRDAVLPRLLPAVEVARAGAVEVLPSRTAR